MVHQRGYIDRHASPEATEHVGNARNKRNSNARPGLSKGLCLLTLTLSDRLSYGARRVNDANIDEATLGVLHAGVNNCIHQNTRQGDSIFLDGHLASKGEHSLQSTLQ